MDISDFFVRSRLSKLRLLDLSGNLDISWNHLVPRTTHLTTLSLQIGEVPSTATLSTSQLFSILVSNPNLRQLKLSDRALPDDNQGVTFQVPLRYLKRLLLSGDLRHLWILASADTPRDVGMHVSDRSRSYSGGRITNPRTVHARLLPTWSQVSSQTRDLSVPLPLLFCDLRRRMRPDHHPGTGLVHPPGI